MYSMLAPYSNNQTLLAVTASIETVRGLMVKLGQSAASTGMLVTNQSPVSGDHTLARGLVIWVRATELGVF